MAAVVKAALSQLYGDWTRSANKPFIIIAVMCLIVAVAEAFGRIIGDGSKISLLIGLAIVTLLVPRLNSFAFGADGIKAELSKIDRNNIAATSEVDAAVNQKLDQIYLELKAVRELLPGTDGTPLTALPASPPLPAVVHAEDPQKGRFGGREINEGRVLQALVEPSTLKGEWCNVMLTVSATRGKPAVSGPVTFFVHDTFSPDVYVVNPDRGTARLVLRAYGAFTVGAIADNGATLELDLAESPNVEAPQDWRER